MSPEGPHIVVLASSAQVVDRVRLALPHARVSRTEPVSPSEAASLALGPGSRLVIVDLDSLDPVVLGAWMAMVRADASKPPVIGLTSRPESLGKLAALATGSGNALGVPFGSGELVVRVAMLNRGTPAGSPGPDDLVVDFLHRSARSGGEEAHLTAVEQSLLFLFLMHPDEILSREQILDDVWGSDYAPDSNVVERHIRSLRRKLRDDWHHPRIIETVHGQGYRLLSTGAPKMTDAQAEASAGEA